MAIVRGGLHGRPSGNVSGIVYGGARTRTGKVVTARELVFPSNPNTAAQALQRLKFKQSLYATRHLTADIWQDDFNRSIGQLPGFQSMMSIILENTDATEEFGIPPDTPLGNLHFPDTFTVETGAGGSGTFEIVWTAEVGLNGTVEDKFNVLAVAVDPTNIDERKINFNLGTVTRADLGLSPAGWIPGWDVIVGCWFEGIGAAVGLLTPVKWYAVTLVA